jgi:hypothetical protein
MRDNGSADDSRENRPSYSPPCYLREVDPAYAGYLTRPEILELLNELLEGERAGARAATQCLGESKDKVAHSTLRRIAIDEARFCAMLSRHIRELGGMPSPATGRFYGKLMAIAGLTNRVAFLNRGQGWVVRRLRDALPRVRDDRLYEDLKVMLEAHEGNIRRCDRLLRLAHSPGGSQETSPA